MQRKKLSFIRKPNRKLYRLRKGWSISHQNNKTNRNIRFSLNREELKIRSRYELMYEAFYIANQFFLYNSEVDDTYYVLNSNWFDKWKSYVNYDYYLENLDFFLQLNDFNKTINIKDFTEKEAEETTYLYNKYTVMVTDHPGSINNNELLIEHSKCYYDRNDKYCIYNYNLKEDLTFGKHFLTVNRAIWKYFQKVYGGKEIKRYTHKIENKDTSLLLEVIFISVIS